MGDGECVKIDLDREGIPARCELYMTGFQPDPFLAVLRGFVPSEQHLIILNVHS